MSFWSRQLGSDLPNNNNKKSNTSQSRKSNEETHQTIGSIPSPTTQNIGPPPTFTTTTKTTTAVGPPPTTTSVVGNASSSSPTAAASADAAAVVPRGRAHPLLAGLTTKQKETNLKSSPLSSNPPPTFSVFTQKNKSESDETKRQEEKEENTTTTTKNNNNDDDVVDYDDTPPKEMDNLVYHDEKHEEDELVQKEMDHETTDPTLDEQEIKLNREEEDTSDAVLPNGWMELIDPTSGNPYYYNEIEQITSWEKPTTTVDNDHEHDEDDDDDDDDDDAVLVQSSNENDTAIEKGQEDYANQYDDDEYVSVSPSNEYEQQQQEEQQEESNEVDADIMITTSKEEKEQSQPSSLQPQPQEQDEQRLPLGWIELVDPTSGNPYYYNEIENTTSWEKPCDNTAEQDKNNDHDNLEAYVSMSKSEEPEEQQQREDVEFYEDDAGVVDLHSELSGEFEATSSLPDHGESPNNSMTAKDDLQHQQQEDEANEQPQTLPLGWIELVDPTTGNPYYYNEIENTTSWDKPAASVTDENENEEANVQDNGIEDYNNDLHEEQTVPDDDDDDDDEYVKHDAAIVGPEEEQEQTLNMGNSHDENDDDVVEGEEEDTSLVHNDNVYEDDTSEKENPTIDELPDGWIELIDPSSGAPYYLNLVDDTTCWERPTGTTSTIKTPLVEEEEDQGNDTLNKESTKDIVNEDGYVSVKLPQAHEQNQNTAAADDDDDEKMTTKSTQALQIETHDLMPPTSNDNAVAVEAMYSPRFNFLSTVSPQLEKLEEQTAKKRFEFHKNIHQLDCRMASIKARMAIDGMDFDLVVRDWLDGGVLRPLEESADRFFQILETNVAHRPTLSATAAASNNIDNDEEVRNNTDDESSDYDATKPSTTTEDTKGSSKATPTTKQTNKRNSTTPTTLVSLERRIIKLDTAMTTHAHRTMHDSKAKNWDTLRSTIQHEMMPTVRLESAKADKREQSIVRRFEVLSGIIARKRAEEVAERKATIAILQKRLDDAVLDDQHQAEEFLQTIQNLRAKLLQEKAERKRCDRKVLDKIMKSTKAMKRALLEHVGSTN